MHCVMTRCLVLFCLSCARVQLQLLELQWPGFMITLASFSRRPTSVRTCSSSLLCANTICKLTFALKISLELSQRFSFLKSFQGHHLTWKSSINETEDSYLLVQLLQTNVAVYKYSTRSASCYFWTIDK